MNPATEIHLKLSLMNHPSSNDPRQAHAYLEIALDALNRASCLLHDSDQEAWALVSAVHGPLHGAKKAVEALVQN